MESERLSLANIGSAAAIIISLAALSVSYLEVSTATRAAKAEAWPYLDISNSYNPEGFEYRIINKGTGPAIIQSILLSYDGKRYERFDPMVVDIVGEADAFGYERFRTTGTRPSVVSPEEERNLFAVDWDPASRRVSEELEQKLVIEVCYCSVFEDCWITQRGQIKPTPVAQCPANTLGPAS